MKLCLCVPLLAFMVGFVGCPGPNPVPPTPDADAAPVPSPVVDATPPPVPDAGPIVGEVCTAYRRFNCLQGGPKCEQVIANIIKTHVTPLDATCIAKAASVVVLRACPGGECTVP